MRNGEFLQAGLENFINLEVTAALISAGWKAWALGTGLKSLTSAGNTEMFLEEDISSE